MMGAEQANGRGACLDPRELSETPDQRTLFLTNFDSTTLAVIDVARLDTASRR